MFHDLDDIYDRGRFPDWENIPAPVDTCELIDGRGKPCGRPAARFFLCRIHPLPYAPYSFCWPHRHRLADELLLEGFELDGKTYDLRLAPAVITATVKASPDESVA